MNHPGPRHLVRKAAVEILNRHDHTRVPIRTLVRESSEKEPLPQDDRVYLQELVFGVTRHRNTIDFILHRTHKDRLTSEEITNPYRIAVYEGRWLNAPLTELTESFFPHNLRAIKHLSSSIGFDLKSATEKLKKVNRLSVLYAHPSFIVETLLKNLQEKEAIALLRSNNGPHTYYVRKNGLSMSDDLQSLLKDMNVKFEQDHDVSWLYRVTEGIHRVVTSKAFKSGRILIQDKASVMAVLALDPGPNDKIWDACAAPGQKTQLIWELMRQSGTLVATDINKDRVTSAQKRCNKLGCEDVEWITSDASRNEIKGISKILIDAPCSSTGMLRSHPSFKWRLNKDTLMSMMTIQNKILASLIDNNPGVEIVFTTCSLLPHEGESQIESMLSTDKIQLKKLGMGSSGYSAFSCSEYVRRFFPHRDDTNGFFISRMRVNS